MRKRIIIVFVGALLAVACNQVDEIGIGEASGISPTVLQKIEVSDRQAILFGHYEHLVTVQGRAFEGCCVFDASRIELANYIVELFENSTGKSFSDREMMIGAVGDLVYVYIVPKSLNATPIEKTYVVELDRKTARLKSFKASSN